MTDEMIVVALKALSDPTRLQIVRFLADCCCKRAELYEDGAVIGPTAGEVCCHITGAERINSTISHHLHELEAAQIITITRRGKSMICSLRPESLLTLGTQLVTLANSQPSDSKCC